MKKELMRKELMVSEHALQGYAEKDFHHSTISIPNSQQIRIVNKKKNQSSAIFHTDTKPQNRRTDLIEEHAQLRVWEKLIEEHEMRS